MNDTQQIATAIYALCIVVALAALGITIVIAEKDFHK